MTAGADAAAYLTADGVTFDERDAELLRAVDEAGSLNAAATDLGRSRARASRRLDELEGAFGPLVERTRGGSGGGGSHLTAGASDLLARFDRLRATLSGVAGTDETVLDGEVVDREGELAVVATPAGRVRALAPASDPGDRVEVTLRADTVTLHDPGAAPDAGDTSARNRLRGTVGAVERGVAVVRVDVDVGPATLAALVTADSADRLDLAAGREVVASFKATATRATPR
jgi:molybdate transport system regulatory protein